MGHGFVCTVMHIDLHVCLSFLFIYWPCDDYGGCENGRRRGCRGHNVLHLDPLLGQSCPVYVVDVLV